MQKLVGSKPIIKVKHWSSVFRNTRGNISRPALLNILCSLLKCALGITAHKQLQKFSLKTLRLINGDFVRKQLLWMQPSLNYFVCSPEQGQNYFHLHKTN